MVLSNTAASRLLQKVAQFMRIVVCEDEQQYQKSIGDKIYRWQQRSGYAGIKTLFFSSSEDFLEQWEKGLTADIIFLDILFTLEMDGMSVAKKIRAADQSITIVFITNSEAYVKDGYEVRAFRYLNKPVCYDDIAQCLDVAYKQYTLSHNEYLILSATGQRIALRYEDVLFLEAQSPYTLIYAYGKKEAIRIRNRFSELIPRLPEEQFVMCHRSYIVNVIHVRRIKRKELTLSNGTILPISRACMNTVNAVFDSYYQERGAYIHVDSI